ncbi:hypothetical protein SA2016_0931 [Sinomonas atrocyanea]|uniref:Competence protein CoiA nuclease-like domain-containing protein n=1 Tax=Sinomonas atrocyanea TaxID=37927 RepID=A0A126ZXD3_9MICC|nr:competence protein CoiA family protein [Sinomonas atrocyanea]AMM31617.1 hypothetical protein SA2016_0931 [Sinomonas atrocyanea]GEB64240.1 hypothetical protein SAT01_16880 [Sinomonas atrocyanea]GGG57546.1 hypothetical protein GCM10007172_05490 [Sinomonas atrocyanea]
MPLAAVLSEERVDASQLDDGAWEALRQRYKAGETLLMPCGQPGVPRRSKLGLKHFAHKPGQNCPLHWDETQEHLELKALLAKAARAAGWEATLEFAADDRSWIADVLVTDGSRRIALEVQWSPQSEDDFVRRQRRYAAAGLECLWFVSSGNVDHAGQVPAFELRGARGSWSLHLMTALGHRTDVPLCDVLVHLLAGNYREPIEPFIQAYSVQVAMVKCWKDACARWLTVWRLDDVQIKTRCGLEGTLEVFYDPFARLFPKQRLEQEFAADVLQWLGHPEVDLPRVATFASRHSKAADRTYLAYCCPHCGAMQGDVPLNEAGTRWRTFVIWRRLALSIDPKLRRLQHLCLDRGKGQCNEYAPSSTKSFFPGAGYSSVRFHTALLTEELDRLPRRGGPRSTESKQVEKQSFPLTSFQINEMLNRGRNARS